jgi:diguanylate cyclase (GGDEF)-like protein
MPSNPSDTKLSRTIASTVTLQLAKIHTSDYFYTPIEERFERITRIARSALRTPVAAITILKPDSQWFKSISGWSVGQLPTDKSLCTWTIEANQLTIVPDMLADERFTSHPLVVAAPKFRFYAGHPLRDSMGVTIGTFCVMDIKPRAVSEREQQLIRDLSMLAQTELETDRLADAQREFVSKLSVARREAMIDPLTRLWNRRGTTIFLRNAIRRADDELKPLAIGIVDIDNFKRINDLHGHPIGDEALRKAAQILTSTLRHDDVVGRYGGDEFLVLLPNTNAAESSEIMNRVRETMFEEAIRTRNGPVRMTASVGCIVREPGESVSEDELVSAADAELSISKSAGRNRVRIA